MFILLVYISRSKSKNKYFTTNLIRFFLNTNYFLSQIYYILSAICNNCDCIKEFIINGILLWFLNVYFVINIMHRQKEGFVYKSVTSIEYN